MDPRRILLVAVLVVGALSFSCLFLPEMVARIYASIMLPFALLIGFILALRVASIYEKELKKSFLFLSLFLILYMLANILALWEFLYSLLGPNTVLLVLLLQVVVYAMLITSCVYILKVIDVKRMNRYGWVSLGVMLPLCIYVVLYEVPWVVTEISVNPVVAIFRMMIRVFDMSIILMLLPVLFLYLQYLRQTAQESITFTIIMGGLIFSLFSTYVFQLAMGISVDTIATEYFQKGSILDTIYIFGYLIVAAGLYVHRKYDEWGYNVVDRAMAGE